MGCGCGGSSTSAKATRYQVTAAAGQTFPDGDRTKIYATKAEAEAAQGTLPGSSLESVS